MPLQIYSLSLGEPPLTTPLWRRGRGRHRGRDDHREPSCAADGFAYDAFCNLKTKPTVYELAPGGVTIVQLAYDPDFYEPQDEAHRRHVGGHFLLLAARQAAAPPVGAMPRAATSSRRRRRRSSHVPRRRHAAHRAHLPHNGRRHRRRVPDIGRPPLEGVARVLWDRENFPHANTLSARARRQAERESERLRNVRSHSRRALHRTPASGATGLCPAPAAARNPGSGVGGGGRGGAGGRSGGCGGKAKACARRSASGPSRKGGGGGGGARRRARARRGGGGGGAPERARRARRRGKEEAAGKPAEARAEGAQGGRGGGGARAQVAAREALGRARRARKRRRRGSKALLKAGHVPKTKEGMRSHAELEKEAQEEALCGAGEGGARDRKGQGGVGPHTEGRAEGGGGARARRRRRRRP